MKRELKELLASLDHTGGGQGHPNSLCAEAAQAIRELTGDRDRGWMIETARATYWDGRQIGRDANFASDANDGARFARFEDAEVVRCWLLEEQSRPQRLRSTEHVFLQRAVQASAA